MKSAAQRTKQTSDKKRNKKMGEKIEKFVKFLIPLTQRIAQTRMCSTHTRKADNGRESTERESEREGGRESVGSAVLILPALI